MRCEEVRQLLPFYLEGDLPATSQQALAGHLENCPSCRRELEELQLTTTLLATWEELEPPADLHQGIMARLAELPKAQPAARAGALPEGEAGLATPSSSPVLGFEPVGAGHIRRWPRMNRFWLVAALFFLAVALNAWSSRWLAQPPVSPLVTAFEAAGPAPSTASSGAPGAVQPGGTAPITAPSPPTFAARAAQPEVAKAPVEKPASGLASTFDRAMTESKPAALETRPATPTPAPAPKSHWQEQAAAALKDNFWRLQELGPQLVIYLAGLLPWLLLVFSVAGFTFLLGRWWGRHRRTPS